MDEDSTAGLHRNRLHHLPSSACASYQAGYIPLAERGRSRRPPGRRTQTMGWNFGWHSSTRSTVDRVGQSERSVRSHYSARSLGSQFRCDFFFTAQSCIRGEASHLPASSWEHQCHARAAPGRPHGQVQSEQRPPRWLNVVPLLPENANIPTSYEGPCSEHDGQDERVGRERTGS
jgi:hypothetical protein